MKINIERTERVKDLLCKCNGICDTGEYFEDLQKLVRNLYYKVSEE